MLPVLPVQVERLWFAAGEIEEQDKRHHVLSMSDGRSSFVEWRGQDVARTQRKRVLSGDVFVRPVNYYWWARPESEKGCVQLRFTPQWFRDVTNAPTAELSLRLLLRDPLVTQLMRALASADTQSASPVHRLYRESLATTLVLHLFNQHSADFKAEPSAGTLSRSQLRTLLDFICEHLDTPITLPEMAGLVNLGVSQFSRLFQATTGETPHRFVMARRVERARDMLASGKYKPAEVALLTGFSDQSHLTRHLRQTLGVTPRQLQTQKNPHAA